MNGISQRQVDESRFWNIWSTLSLGQPHPTVIGLVGGQGVGKTTAATYLWSHYGTHTYAIANELKELLADFLTLTSVQLYGSQADKEAIDPRWGLSSRVLMRRLGDAVRRVYGSEFQVSRLFQKISLGRQKIALVEDVRFIDEADFLSRKGAILWRLHPVAAQSWPSAHRSETEWEQCVVHYEVRPQVAGLRPLQDAIDKACMAYGIRPIECS